MEPIVYTPVSAVANLRRSIYLSCGLGVIALVVFSLAGHPLAGVFTCVGLGLGAVNNRLLQRSVIARAMGGVSKSRFSGGVFMRLGGVTLLAVVAALLVHPDGLAVFLGLAVFHVVMLVGAALPVFRSLRPSA